ncbi:MAG: asparagine synthase (glutamine-hydrolyzing) [Candidatus Melainabacteria bacterium]|nr:asparagine synthase (glutamine-hydrolyzing) [Candidatus Melainabacteria bacterium]
MCGISGVFGLPDVETVDTMLNTLRHRGPDGGCSVVGTCFSLGARRLSILDPLGGRQPLANETNTVWAVHNGELYNFPAIRSQLVAEGHKLLTQCDTEILPHLYERCGTQLVELIDGMFAIALWDETNMVGFLARDRMGKKPLYYHWTGKALYFASEIKALLCMPGFQRQINLQALDYYLSYKHVPCPLSIFQDIHSLPPAHKLIFRPGQEPQISRYWDVDFSESKDILTWSEEEVVEQLLSLLQTSVKQRLMSDVPIGFFLSGGIDSSLSTVMAAELSSRPIKTFTLTYGNDSTTAGKEQDRRWATWVAQKYRTDHYEEMVTFEDLPRSLRHIISCFDEPFAGTVSTYFLASLVAQHVKVALSGDGADELFGSYLSHRLAFPLAHYPEYTQTGDTSLIRPFNLQPETLARLAEPEDWQWRSKLFVFSDEEKKTLYSPDLQAATHTACARERLRHDFLNLTASDPLNRILEAEFRTIFPDQVLTFVDRLSMAHSLEVRSAYLNTDLVRFVASLPGQLKIKDGETKYILKKAALKYFPRDMVFRRKEGFLMPITEWIASDLEGYVRETLSAERLSKHGIFQVATVQSLVDRLYSSQSDHTDVNKVLSLIIFQEWYELYMEGRQQSACAVNNTEMKWKTAQHCYLPTQHFGYVG